MESIKQFFTDIFPSASGQASEINSLFGYFLIMSAIILFIVLFMIIAGLVKYRHSRRPETPGQETGSLAIEVLWTVVPFMTVAYFFILSLISMRNINKDPENIGDPDIIITGHQWWWEFYYPKLGIKAANELHVPSGKTMSMQIKSADVIHSWWVTDLGRKIDAVPGRTNYGWIKADRAGKYDGTCSEFCGAQHAWMRISVFAQSGKDFNDSVINQKSLPSIPTEGQAYKGYMLFIQKTCSNCHAISGTQAKASIGPDLTHVASRQTLLSGMKPNTRENMFAWLKNPQSIKPGSHMPDFLLSDDDIQTLVSFMEVLK